MQIIVLGMHRSGTSMVTRMVNMMGAYFGPEKSSLGFNKDNPKGFWERKEVMQLNDTILRQHQTTWDKVANWKPGPPDALSTDLRRAIKSFVLDMDAHRPWVLKDPRHCLTLPYWRPYLEMPVGVVVYRDAEEVARSLEIRNNFPLEFGLALWEFYNVHLLNASLSMPRIFVRHQDFFQNPIAATHALHSMLVKHDVQGLRIPSDREITAFVDGKLYRSRPTQNTPMADKPAFKQLKALLLGEIPQTGMLTVSEESMYLLMQEDSKLERLVEF